MNFITQISLPTKVDDRSNSVSHCSDEVSALMKINQLQLNPSKTEVLWFSVFFSALLAPDPHQSSSNRQHLSLVSQILYTWCHHEDPSHCCRLIVFRGTLTDLLHAAFSTTTCRANSDRTLMISKVDYCCSVLIGISSHLLSKLQSALNAADWVTVWRGGQITQVQFLLCILTYGSLHGTAPSYLADSLRRCSNTEGHHHFHSSVTDTLVVTPTNCSTLGDHAFSVAASRAQNGLLASVRTATSLSRFRQQLKTILYRQCFC